MKLVTWAAVVVALARCVEFTNAQDILFDNAVGGPSQLTQACQSDYDTSFRGDQRFRAEDFSILNESVVTGVRWTGMYAGSNTPTESDDFEINFYEDVLGSPADVPFLTIDVTATREDSGFNVAPPFEGFDVYTYSADFPPVEWTVPSVFWISIRNNTVGAADDWFWGAEHLLEIGNSHRIIDGGPWLEDTFQLDFQIVGEIAPGGVQDPIVINLTATDLAYSSFSETLYASMPNSSTTNPNSLTPIDPTTGALGTPLAVGFDPQAMAISSDGTIIHTVFGGEVGIQPFDIEALSFGTPFFIPGGPRVKQIIAIPDRPSAVLISTFMSASPPATGTAVWENGVRLPNVVGTGLGTGGPDEIAVDPTDGTRGYGYQNTVSSYTNWNLHIDENGVDSGGGPTLQGFMTGHRGHIERLNGRIFTDHGEVLEIDPPFQSAAFLAGRDFILDPANNLLFSIDSSGVTQRLRIYDLNTLELLSTQMLTGVPGLAQSLTLIGSSGVAFRTTEDRIVVLAHPTNSFEDPDHSLLVTHGILVSGGLTELAESDNMDLSLRRLSTDVQSRTEFEIKSTSPTATPSSFEFTLEGAVFARSNVVQTIELFDYDAASWELVSATDAARSPSPDSVVTGVGTGDLSRFVEDGTMCIEARVRYLSDSPRQNFASNTDQAVWTIGQ